MTFVNVVEKLLKQQETPLIVRKTRAVHGKSIYFLEA